MSEHSASNAVQRSLFAVADTLQSRVITQRHDFEELFEGFTALRAVSYVASPSLLLEFLSGRGFTHLELILGDSLAAVDRDSLAAAGVDCLDRLAELTESGRLKVLVPKRTIHTKLYLLSGPAHTRVIQASANLTETARDAARQTNYAWYIDLPDDHPWLKRVIRDYATHAARCTVFLDDLISLIRSTPERPRREIIEAWLTGAVPTAAEAETATLVGEVTEWALNPEQPEDAVYTVRLPDAPASRKSAERLIARLGGSAASNGMRIERSAFLTHVDRYLSLPLMRIDTEPAQIRMALAGTVWNLLPAAADAAVVNAGLDHLERYVGTVEWGEALDRLYAKTAMYEAMLYMFAAPFANEHMKVLRRRYGALERRGPRMLYLVGPSSNGKTTFLRFALLLLTERHVRPLIATDFTKGKVLQAISLGTCFPLVFDDVNPTQRSSFEEIMKSHWENWWMPSGASPQLVISSNNPALPEWAKSRVQRIDFDVHFAQSERNSARLARLFEEPNRIFPCFAQAYLAQLRRLEEPVDDELFLAREVMAALYHLAGRSVPDFFPTKPLEATYDPGRMRWRDLLERSRQAIPRRDGQRVIIEFAGDLQHHEVKRYLSLLPQTVKAEQRGRKLIVDNPREFDRWLGPDRSGPLRWLRRRLGRG